MQVTIKKGHRPDEFPDHDRLGAIREEAELLEQAVARFEAMELRWHAKQTLALLATRG